VSLQTPLATVLAVALAFVLAAVAVRAARAVVRRLLKALEVVGAENRAAMDVRARQLIRGLTLLAYGVAAAVSISFGLSRLGIDEARWDPRQLTRWSLSHGVNIVVIVVGAYVVIHAANMLIDHLQFKLGRRQALSDLEWQRRAATLGGILTSLVTASVVFVAGLMLLRELSIDVLPILTGAGIAGLAIGFGAQNLVRDVISGFFLILEDQVRVGDLARINGVAGKIEQINLRTIVLRDGEGAVQVFPNGTVTALANLSKHFAYALVEVRVPYSENVDRVIGTIREVGAGMERDPNWGPLLLAPLEVPGIESLADGMTTIRARFKTVPLNPGPVSNELRRRLLGAFISRGIRPYAGA
jgi:moderate conductance mechanosensitive channel